MKRLMMMAAAAVVMALGAATETVNGVTWKYEIEDGEAAILAPNSESSCGGIPGLKGDLTLPAMLGGCPVTRLAPGVLWGAGELTSLVIPDSVRTIGNGALQALVGVTNVVIGAGVTVFGMPFADCYSLKTIKVAEANPAFAVKDGVLYDKTFTRLCCYPCALALTAKSFEIPEGVTELGTYAFSDTPLTRIVVPASVHFLSYGAFCQCADLESLVFRGDAPQEGGHAFVDVPESCVVYIEKGTAGWDDDGDGKWLGMRLKYGDGSDVVEPSPEPVPGPPPAPQDVCVAASEYDGYLVDGEERLRGILQIKVGKPNAATGLAAVRATLVLDGAKKSLKGANGGKVAVSTDGPTSLSLSGGEACSVTLGHDSLSGRYGACSIRGGRNLFLSKDKVEARAAAAALAPRLGAVNAVWRGGMVTLSLAKKGRAKVAITPAEGRKASVTAQAILGEDGIMVPVSAPKAGVSFLVRLDNAAGDVEVYGLGDDVVAGAPNPGDALTFGLSGGVGALAGVQTAFLPMDYRFSGGAKWVFRKADVVKMVDGVAAVAKDNGNPSGLKLAYKAKDGSFKGSFKVYALEGGRLKKHTFSVTGVVAGGVGYGRATCRRPAASWTVTVR